MSLKDITKTVEMEYIIFIVTYGLAVLINYYFYYVIYHQAHGELGSFTVPPVVQIFTPIFNLLIVGYIFLCFVVVAFLEFKSYLASEKINDWLFGKKIEK